MCTSKFEISLKTWGFQSPKKILSESLKKAETWGDTRGFGPVFTLNPFATGESRVAHLYSTVLREEKDLLVLSTAIRIALITVFWTFEADILQSVKFSQPTCVCVLFCKPFWHSPARDGVSYVWSGTDIFDSFFYSTTASNWPFIITVWTCLQKMLVENRD